VPPEDDEGRSRLGPEEIVQFGRPHDDRPGRGRWVTRLLLACLVLAAVVVVVTRGSDHPTKARAAPAKPPPPIQVFSAGHALLGVTAGWELFARGRDDVIRIQMAAGRTTITYVPTLETGNPEVAFDVGAHEVVIRSADYVPGYVVPDGHQARLLSGALAGGGPLVPGPQPEQEFWVTTNSPAAPGLALVTLAGRRTGEPISFQSGGLQVPATAVSDGRGYVLVGTGDFTAYDVGPGWDRQVTSPILAVGPVTWLALHCNAALRHCRNEVVSAATGKGRDLPGPPLGQYYGFVWPPLGVTSPDGRMAAVLTSNNYAWETVHLVDLRTGAVKNLGITVGQTTGDQPPGGAASNESMVWSPDGKWLFVATTRGTIDVINARTGQVQSLGVTLPPVVQLAIRP
jgi:hypothetical protein